MRTTSLSRRRAAALGMASVLTARVARADAGERFGALLRDGILTRPFAQTPDRVRFGLPADELAWERLTRAV